MNTIVLDGKNLSVEKLLKAARFNAVVTLSEDAQERIKRCRRFFDKQLDSSRPVYGVNTGIGKFSEVHLSQKDLEENQRNLIYSHAAGIGESAPVELVRASMVSRINVHAKGYSAVRLEVVLKLMEMLNKGVTPVVCLKGSVGACGDLAPMAQVALSLFGQGEVFYHLRRLPTKIAFKEAGIDFLELKVRDGLALINGSNVLTAYSALQLYDVDCWLRQCELSCAMGFEALNANVQTLDKRLHGVRGFQGSVRSAEAIENCLKGGALFEREIATRVQDAYSLRSTPQVIGSAHDAVAYAKSQVEIELNGVGDNPVWVVEDEDILTGANFQGIPVSLPMEMVGAAVTSVSVLCERRMNRLLNENLSEGLPAFLSHDPGVYTGMMISQYTADALIVEQRMLSAPACVGSIPASADQEDFVSMGMNTAIKNAQILDNAYGVLGIELMVAAQALDFRDRRFGVIVDQARHVIREQVPHLYKDRPLYKDHGIMKRLVKGGALLKILV